jgi:hypothetical protein
MGVAIIQGRLESLALSDIRRRLVSPSRVMADELGEISWPWV